MSGQMKTIPYTMHTNDVFNTYFSFVIILDDAMNSTLQIEECNKKKALTIKFCETFVKKLHHKHKVSISQ